MNYANKLSVFLAIVLTVGFVLPGTARAQQDLSELQQLLNQEVTTASRGDEKVSEAPATMRVITEDQIENRGYKDLKDIFRDLPGFDLSENLEGEVRTLAMSRGILGANKLLVLQDGRRLNSPGGERFVLGNNHPLHHVKRIEVMYGPAASLYGADAYAGVVNMITKSPEEIAGDDNVEVDVAYGTNKRKDINLSVGKKVNQDVSFKLNGRIFESDGEDVLDQFSVDEITFENQPSHFRDNNPQGWEQPISDYNLSGEMKVNNFRFGFRRESAEEPNGPSTEYVSPGVETFVYDDEYVWHQIMNKLYAEHSYQGDDFSIETSLEYNDYEVDPKTQFHYSDDGMGLGSQYKYARSKSTELESVLETQINEATDFTGGISVESVTIFPKTSNLLSPFNRDQLIDTITYPNDSSIDPRYRNSTVTFGAFDEYNLGVFGELKYDVTDQLTVHSGLRVDNNSNYQETFNPRLGAIYNPSEWTNVKALYGEAYIQPSKYIAYEHFSAGSFGVYPNPDLKPEELKSYQFNVSHFVTESLQVGLNSFLYQIENLHRTQGSPFFKNVASGEPESKGFELTFDYSTENTRSYLYYSFLDSEKSDGEPQSKVADNKIHAGVTYDYKQYSISPRVRWSDEKPRLEGGSTTVQSGIDGHTVVDLDVRRNDFWEGADAYLSITNLLDEKYYTASPFGEDDDGFLMDKAPQPGINGEVGITYRF